MEIRKGTNHFSQHCQRKAGDCSQGEEVQLWKHKAYHEKLTTHHQHHKSKDMEIPSIHTACKKQLQFV